MGYEKAQRPLFMGSASFSIASATSAGTTILPRGVTQLNSTSTGVNVVMSLGAPRVGKKAGFSHVTLVVNAIGDTTGGPFHIEAASSGITFDGTNDMVALSSVGASISLIAFSTSRWLVTSGNGFVLGAST